MDCFQVFCAYCWSNFFEVSPDYVAAAVVVLRLVAGQAAGVAEVVAKGCKSENMYSVVVDVGFGSRNYSIASSCFDASTYSYWRDFCDQHEDQPTALVIDTNNMTRQNVMTATILGFRLGKKIVYFCWTCHHCDFASFSCDSFTILKMIIITWILKLNFQRKLNRKNKMKTADKSSLVIFVYFHTCKPSRLFVKMTNFIKVNTITRLGLN